MTTTTETGATLAPVQFDAPLANPAPGGLYAATAWTDEPAGGPLRWLADGVVVRPHNYGGENAFGVWAADWCASPDDLAEGDIKDGVRPITPDSFAPVTVWAYDECDLTAPSQAEIVERVQQNLRLQEPVAVEREFAARALLDAGTPTGADDLVEAISILEAAFAKTNTVGLVHASPAWAAVADRHNLIRRSGGALRTPLGHRWVLGGGYADGLGGTLVATGPTFGWRGEVTTTETTKPQHNLAVAIAERSVVVGYEAAVAAVELP
jgi:hypothetical protein